MPDALTVAIVPALIGFLAGVLVALVTTFLTPLLQHFFWIGRQREELRLKTVDEINALLSRYITEHIHAEHRGEQYDPPVAFFQSLRVADAKLRVLFSEGTFAAYKQAEVMISHGGLGPEGTIEGFMAAHEDALRTMYTELGFFDGLTAHLRRGWAAVSTDARISRAAYAALAVGILLFLFAVWPTPYRYDHENIRAGEVSRTTLVRVNRLTGTTEILGEHGWSRPSSSPQVLPPDELAKVSGTASFDSLSGNLAGNIYNGTHWTVTSLTFRVVARRTDGTLEWDRQFLDNAVSVGPLSTGNFRVWIGEALTPPPPKGFIPDRPYVAGTWSIVAGRGTPPTEGQR